MNFERLKESHLKRNIIIGVVAVLIISAVILNFTIAKYRVTESIPLVNGTINYTPYDFKMVAMYQANGSGGYDSIDVMPSSGYAINEERSYCEINGVKDSNAKLYTNSNSEHVIANLQKGTKCYLYFDELSLSEVTLAKLGLAVNNETPDFSKTAQANCSGVSNCEETNGIYEGEDDNGTTYYWRGAVDNNWVYFGGFYWRIIRINGNGSVRLLYNGTSTATTGTMTSTRQVFNSSRERSEYVGLKYTTRSQHGTGTNSLILNTLNSWYSSSNLDDYASYIDSNVGFCSDREMASGYTWSSQPSSAIRYAAFERLETNKTPSFNCSNSSDVLKIPVGLITADEVAFAGGRYGTSNSSYYLYNGQYYWTMSPRYYPYAYVFEVCSDGNLDWSNVTSGSGVRPVINLKATTQFTGSGTTSDPYEVS